jgi:uncharacterized membrane protein (TIGR02234 family)
VTAAPSGPPEAAGPPAPALRRAGSRAVAVLAVLAGVGLALMATGQPWVTVRLPGGGNAAADGRLAAPGAVAVALVAAAGAVVLLTSGRAVRMLVAGLLLLAGVLVTGLTVPVWQDPAAAASPAVARVTGTVGRAGGTASTTFWPVLSAAGGLLIAAGAVVALVRGRRWPGPSRRYERSTTPAGGGPDGRRDGEADAWDRLSRGEDPTD